MAPLEISTKELDQNKTEKIVKFVSDIRNGKIDGSDIMALKMLDILEQIINESENATAYELITAVRTAGRFVSGALPLWPVPANVARRVLRAIRDEHRAHSEQTGGAMATVEGSGDSLQRLVLGTAARRGTMGASQPDLKEPLRDHIAELRNELESSGSLVSGQARAHVHAAELILTAGGEPTAAAFLRAARAHTHYRLLMAEGTDLQSHATAARLSAAGVPVTVINDAAVFGVMSRVNKVVIGVEGVLAGGALLAKVGVRAVTTAALHHRVPVIALCPLYKLSPLHTVECAPGRPHAASAVTHPCAESGLCQMQSPRLEVVPPDHVALFLTNLGGSSPSYIYRLLSELYDPSDHQL